VKHIGIVAVSAEGASLCYRTVCLEGAALLGSYGHPEISMHTHALADYMKRIERDDWIGVGQLLLDSAAKLSRAGAEILVCPDNTVHQALDLVRSESTVPWLHIAEEVADVATQHRLRRLGVLGTRYLMEGPVYAGALGKRGISSEIPDPDDRARINAVIFDELVQGKLEGQSRTYLRSVIEALGRCGCDAVVLGCTEIPLLISQADSPLPLIDSTRTLARAALREATAPT
jgi:aspartate racemase